MGLLLSPDHAATLTDPTTWRDNPFVTRDARRDVKKRQPYLSFCWMCGVLLLVLAWGGATLWSTGGSVRDTPLLIGGHIGIGLFVVVSGIHIWFIVGAARKHATRMFTEESNQNTLSSLLLLPMSPFQILAQTMVYPWLAAMRLAIVLLPVYAFCVGIDGPSWLDLIMLYVVFAMAALVVPQWNRPALSENVGILAPAKQSRFLTNATQGSVGQEPGAVRSVGATGAVLLRLALILIVLVWIGISSGGNLKYATDWLLRYLPDSIISLLVAVALPVAWPLAIARILITPLDWFGIGIIPLPFVLALFLLGKYAQLARASEFLSVGAYRDLPLQSTYRPRLHLNAGIRIAQALVITGYLWKFAVADGGFGRFAPQIAGSDPGLAGFAMLLFLFAGLWGCARGLAMGQWQHKPLIRGERFILCRNSLLDAVRYLSEPFGFALAFYLVCCLLARTAPFPPLLNGAAGSVGEMILQMALIGLAGSALSFGISRLFGGSALIARFTAPILIAVGAYSSASPSMQYWQANFPQITRALAFIPHLRDLQIFSPFLGMLQAAAPRLGVVQNLLPGSPPWYGWVLASLVAGGALWLLALLLDRRKASAQEDAVTLVFNPTILGRDAFSDPIQSKRASAGRSDTPFVAVAIARLQRVWDNAVMARELRSRLRGQWERPVLLGALAVAALFSAVCFIPQITFLPTLFGSGTAWLLMGSMPNALSGTAASILGCWYLVLFITAVCNSFVTTGAFFAETQKSTLGFMLATPMKTRSIVLGKALGMMGPSLGVLTAISAWILLLTLLFLPLVGPLALLGWLYGVLSALTFYLMVNGVTFAISAMFPKLSMSGSAWIWLLLFWCGGWPFAGISVLLWLALGGANSHGGGAWVAFMGMGWLVILLAYAVSESSIQSMRRRDLTFESTKRGG